MNEQLLPKDEIKKAIYQDIITKNFQSKELPEEIFILSGGIAKIEKEHQFKSLSYAQDDTHGLITGGKARVIAASELAKVFPELRFVTTSKTEIGSTSDAEVMKSELINRGVNPDQISLEENSTSTITELIEMVKLALNNNWSRLSILTNDYHIPRCQTMFDNLEEITGNIPEIITAITEFRLKGIKVNFVPAEDILINANPHYTNLINHVKKSAGYNRRVSAEQQGLEDLKAGRYKLG